MILHALRKHLAEELEKLPDNGEQVFESYAVTTAALAKQLLDYLAIDDLTVPTDDRYVARHLFRRTVTLTNTVMRTSIELDDRRAEEAP